MPPSKDNEFSLSPEIDRLSSQLAKDPKSKLFMPLAEEYIKAGMAEEAIMTLEEGLKVHPAYMSARVLLGKAFLEKNDLENARTQFETVVKAIPDNLFAYKKLGEVYKGLGMYPEATKSYKMVLLLHPKDADARLALDVLQGGVPPAAAKPEPEAKPAGPAPQVFDLSDVGGEPPEAEEVLDVEVPLMAGEPAVMEMPVPEMETLETVRMAQAEEPSDFGFAGEEEEEVPVMPTYEIEAEAGGFEFAAEEPVEEAATPVYEIEEEAGGFEFAAEEPAEAIVTPPYEFQEEAGGFEFAAEEPAAPTYEIEAEAGGFDLESSPLVMEDEHFGGLEAAPAATDEAFTWGGGDESVHELTPEVESDMFDLESSPLVMEEEEAEAPRPVAGSGYAIDLAEVSGVKDIFEAYKDDTAAEEAGPGENEGVYEIPDDLSAFAEEGFKLEPPKAAPVPEPARAEPPAPEKPAKEVFETETLADLYVSQGFYDRAINIYKNLQVERPDDLTIKQKLQELYQLAQLAASMASFGEESGPAQAETPRETYTPVDFDAVAEEEPAAFGAEPAEAGFMEAAGFEEEAWGGMAEAGGAAAAAPKAAGGPVDPDAVRRLEGLLENIRRKRAI